MKECGPTDISIYRFLYAFTTAIDKNDKDLDLAFKFYIDVLPNLVMKASNIGMKQFNMVEQYLQANNSKKAGSINNKRSIQVNGNTAIPQIDIEKAVIHLSKQ